MLTRVKLKTGEGELEMFIPEIGRLHHRRKMVEDYGTKDEKDFYKSFYQMADRVEK